MTNALIPRHLWLLLFSLPSGRQTELSDKSEPFHEHLSFDPTPFQSTPLESELQHPYELSNIDLFQQANSSNILKRRQLWNLVLFCLELYVAKLVLNTEGVVL